MKLAIFDGKFYLCEYENSYGWYGYEITHEAYDALRDCNIEGNEVDLNKYEEELD